jgi:hypothetical protein
MAIGGNIRWPPLEDSRGRLRGAFHGRRQPAPGSTARPGRGPGCSARITALWIPFPDGLRSALNDRDIVSGLSDEVGSVETVAVGPVQTVVLGFYRRWT